VLVRFAPASLTAEQYDHVVAKLDAAASPPPKATIARSAPVGGQLQGQHGLNSQAQLDAFGARLGPILAELGIDPGEPEIVEVHSIIKR
jgi:hypothetical protein